MVFRHINSTRQRKRASWAIPHMEMQESRSRLFFTDELPVFVLGTVETYGHWMRTGSRFTEYNSRDVARFQAKILKIHICGIKRFRFSEINLNVKLKRLKKNIKKKLLEFIALIFNNVHGIARNVWKISIIQHIWDKIFFHCEDARETE